VRYLSHNEVRRLVDATDPGSRQMVQAALLTGHQRADTAKRRFDVGVLILLKALLFAF
jgi:hypothetical protein